MVTLTPSTSPSSLSVDNSNNSNTNNNSGGFSAEYVVLLFVMLVLGVLFVKLVSMLIFLFLDGDKSIPIQVEVNITTISHADVVSVSKLNAEEADDSLYNKPWNPTPHTSSNMNEVYALNIADLNLPSAVLMALAYDEDQVQCVLTGADQVIQPIIVPYSTILEFREREAQRQREREEQEKKNNDSNNKSTKVNTTSNNNNNNNNYNNRSSSPSFPSRSACSSTASAVDGIIGIDTGSVTRGNSPYNNNNNNSSSPSRHPVVRIASFEGRWDSIQGQRGHASMARRHTAELQLPSHLYDCHDNSNHTDSNENGINTSRYLAVRNNIHSSSLSNINTSTGSLSGFGLPSIRHSNLSTTATPLARSTAAGRGSRGRGVSITQRIRAVSVMIFPGFDHESYNNNANNINRVYNGEHHNVIDINENDGNDDGNDSARAMLSSSTSAFGINNSSINNNLNNNNNNSGNSSNINALMRRVSLPELSLPWINSNSHNDSTLLYATGEPLMPLAEVMSDDALLQEELNTVQLNEPNLNQGELL